MREGKESRTAVMVCAGRAVAHGRTAVPGFEDPTALALLPPDARAEVERIRAGEPPRGLRERLGRPMTLRRADMTAVRTVAIDRVIREAAHPQLVTLGAGLDGRAWRMPELAEAVVFEVDHPSSQRAKRERVAQLTPVSREVRFVPVDFRAGTRERQKVARTRTGPRSGRTAVRSNSGRDDLDAALAAAGHDPAVPTTWIWEGVVMYLTPGEIEATLSVVRRRSAPGSRLVVVYHAPSRMLWLVGALVRSVGEPLRSSFEPEAMRALLARFGFEALRDDDLPTLAAALATELREATRAMRHVRIVVAAHSG